MTDIVDQQTRSRMMSGIRGRNTRPELRLRSALHAAGLRYRIHRKDLPGSPDLVFPKFGAVVFVHGCFWHRHPGCPKATSPSTRPEFWADKFAKNIERDERSRQSLIDAGWRVATVWECSLKEYGTEDLVTTVRSWLQGDGQELEV
ncbi:MAG: very short patch repair endonuclease [Novosphingobium sp.]